ncbi:MAG: EamA family transporter [Lachnospiraceae bacterium]|jgi:drug/metabolite transporter (DMT)-like permease|nr:EamA family transporter [Lachnospiraceae bacterium]MDD3615568.1 EamA family transporter [Lachnospiraceae bacterium]
MKKKKITLPGILSIQAAVLIYTLSGICAKMAAGHEFLSFWFIFFYGLEICVLGVYAIVWQQIIKRYELSVAYVNRATAIFWSLIWAALIFREHISWKNILGVAIIFVGIMVVNTDEN